ILSGREPQPIMRFISCALLTLFATVAASQPTNGNLSCSPNYSVPEGGVEVTIQTNNFHRFKAPQVFFGGVSSPRVTLVDPDHVKAVAPAHATGVVDVMIIDGDVVLHSFLPFAYTPELEEILIPIAFQPIEANYGTRWVSEISVYNDSDDTVPVDPELCFFIGLWSDCSARARRVPPHSSLRIEPQSNRADTPAMFLRPPADHADRLHLTVRLRETSRDPDGPGLEIPVVRSHDFQRKRVVLPSVPVSPHFRSTLRVYTRSDFVRVKVTDNTTGELLKEWSARRFYPSDSDPFGTVTIPGVLEAAEVRSHDRVRIEVESVFIPLPVWAMLTLTDNESQRVQIFTPQ
ncbi:MAG TPA: IPT/TIG domain-containing protein, partial [Thermoanaerobaculia bacterium]|nr:IPT/TIG domain-containing protein [Thermoanaerobaculia bacterium]